MRKHQRLSPRAAKSKLAVAMKKLDAHIEVSFYATQTVTAQTSVLKLSLAAIGVVTGYCTRAELDELSKSVAAALDISHHVTDAFVDFQIATTELSIATSGRC